MSWRHSEAIASIDGLRSTHAAVLMALAHHADQFTGSCYPSLERMIAFTRLSRSSLKKAITELVDLGLVVADRRGGRGNASDYTLVLPGADLIAVGKGPRQRLKGPAQDIKGPRHGPQQSEQNLTETRASRTRASEMLPDGWRPDDVALARARKDFPDVDLDLETNRFVDTNRANGTLIAEPTSAWRAWLGRGAQFAARDKAQSAAAGGTGRSRGSSDRTAAPGLRAMLSAPPRVVGYGLAGPPDDADR